MPLLTESKSSTLRDIINSIFYDEDEFKDCIETRLNIRYFDYVTRGRLFPIQIRELIQRFNVDELSEKLILAICNEKPKSKELLKFALSYNISFSAYRDDPTIEIDNSGLQALINNITFDNPIDIINGISNIRKCVCRIELVNENGSNTYGTGFLVGNNKVLTNYHVVESAIKNPNLLANVICRFDYEESLQLQVLNAGNCYQISPNIQDIVYSQYCDFDVQGTAELNVAWPVDCLDYALLTLNENIGEKPYGLNAQNVIYTTGRNELRGWIRLPNTPPNLFRGRHIIIFQHPERHPLKIGFGFQKLLGTDSNRQRVRYEVNTLNGSSGAPGFDEHFNWIALHNSGDPRWNPQYNQGIPAFRIIEDLNQRGVNL